MTAPRCMTCATDARLTNGAEVYPHRLDLQAKPIWKCDSCGGYVGCHPGTTNPLGTPAGPELRAARSALHDRVVDPLWRSAHLNAAYKNSDLVRGRKDICRAARSRVYEFLAARLHLTADECHVGMFDLETCKRARLALAGVTYSQIRDWAKRRRHSAQEVQA
ncbi:MAG: zinc-finger-containing protein [Methylovulum sp.]|nr:zinc-finger-containing protein [Methylovulum sp.]